MLLGIDICSTNRLSKALHRSPFLREKVFSAAEREYCDSMARPEQHLAGRWAAKEACLKAFGLSVLGYELDKLEVVHEPSGRPEIRVVCPRLQADMERAAPAGDFHIQLSISHDSDYAVACVTVTP